MLSGVGLARNKELIAVLATPKYLGKGKVAVVLGVLAVVGVGVCCKIGDVVDSFINKVRRSKADKA